MCVGQAPPMRPSSGARASSCWWLFCMRPGSTIVVRSSSVMVTVHLFSVIIHPSVSLYVLPPSVCLRYRCLFPFWLAQTMSAWGVPLFMSLLYRSLILSFICRIRLLVSVLFPAFAFSSFLSIAALRISFLPHGYRAP